MRGRPGSPRPELMHYKRVIPCLDVDRGRVVKGVRSVPRRRRPGRARQPRRRRSQRAVFLDITATSDARHGRRARSPCGRRSLHPVHDRWRIRFGRRGPGGARRRRRQDLGQLGGARPPGADLELRARSASQCVVLAIDAKERATGGWEAYVAGGRTADGSRRGAVGARRGAAGGGEILLTSMDRDGTSLGYDLALLRRSPRRSRAGDRLGRRGRAEPTYEASGPARRGAVRLDSARRPAHGAEVKRHLAGDGVPVRLASVSSRCRDAQPESRVPRLRARACSAADPRPPGPTCSFV